MSFMQDDFDEGIEVRVVPGQIMPEDRMYRAERATEAAQAGLLDPLSFFEATQWDNPQKQAKRLIMWQTNPFSIIEMNDEDRAKLQEAMQMFGEEGEEGKKAEQISAVRQEAERLINSPEFQNLPEEEKKVAIQEIQSKLENLTKAGSAETK